MSEEISKIKQLKIELEKGEISLNQALIKLSTGRKEKPCTLYLKASSTWGIDSILIGKEMDKLGIKITKCYWGCFSKSDYRVNRNFTVEIEKLKELIILTNSKQVSCNYLWSLLPNHKKILIDTVGFLIASGVKITNCRLGFFR